MNEPPVRLARSPTETEDLGARLGAVLQPGDFVGLSGGLGAGKTVFVRGVARGAAVPPGALVSSPTFAIVNAYRNGRLPVYHADLYRIADAEELYDAGFYEIGADGALLVEWIDRVPSIAPPDWLEVRLRPVPAGREVTIMAHGQRGGVLAQAMAADG